MYIVLTTGTVLLPYVNCYCMYVYVYVYVCIGSRYGTVTVQVYSITRSNQSRNLNMNSLRSTNLGESGTWREPSLACLALCKGR